MAGKHRLWKVGYSYRVQTIDMLPYMQWQGMQYLIVAQTREEAMEKSDKHFASLDPMNKKLLAKDEASGGGATLSGLRKLVEEYEEHFRTPKLTLESDRRRFSLNPEFSGQDCLRYKVKKLSG